MASAASMSNVVRSDQSRRGSGGVDAWCQQEREHTVVFADVEAMSHSDITSIGEEVQRAGNQTCRGDSLDVDGPGDQDRVAGSRRHGAQPAICASRDSRAARVVPLVCSQPVMASRTGRRLSDRSWR
jgi:hypothetical protein